ncbi:MAG: WYL domain-containing protein [Bacteroidales bacterium]|nr:WYL domain-containing protein [Bacteroidales bacterium]
MSQNKKALIRYLVLDRCFRNTGRRYYFDDLLEEVNHKLEREEGLKGIGRTQLYKDISFMRFSEWQAPVISHHDGHRVWYRYDNRQFTISNQPINETEAAMIREALMVLRRFQGMPQFVWVSELLPRIEQAFGLKHGSEEIIGFDSNEFLEGLHFLGELFEAIYFQKVIRILYKPFTADKADWQVFHPYYLKQSNRRWFVLGKAPGLRDLNILALDRIVEIKDTGKKWDEDHGIDFTEYFEDIIGVTHQADTEPVDIDLFFTPEQAPYIITKPLHGSQRKISHDDKGLHIRIKVKPNYELEKLLMSFGDNLVVLSPLSIRQKIAERMSRAADAYKT